MAKYQRGNGPNGELTQRQKDVLDFIAVHEVEHGLPPTVQQLRSHFQYGGDGSIRWVLKCLVAKGFAEQVDRVRRGRQESLWSDAEMQILAENYSTLGTAGCCLLLPKRDRDQIRSKASVMGLAEVRLDEVDRFYSKIQVTPGCWIWNGSLFDRGYGQFSTPGKNWQAHRYSYTHYVGEIPDGLCVCHTCDNPACVNPDHFFLGTHKDNAEDRVRKGRNPIPMVGEDCRLSKLKEVEVVAIRQAPGSCTEIAKQFGISSSNVSVIKSRKSWAHLPEVSAEVDS